MRLAKSHVVSVPLLLPPYLRWPRLIPSFNAFCRNEPSVLLVSFIILTIGVLALE
jgi:hypothetical protein